MAGGIDDVTAAAKKIMGKDIKLPNRPATAQKAFETVLAKKKLFDKGRQDLKELIEDLHESVFDLAQEFDGWNKIIEKSDFGLDTKDPDYKKNRAAAQKLYDAWFDREEQTYVRNAATVMEIAKHLASMSDYESPKSPAK